MFREKHVVVKTFKSPGQMQRAAERMAGSGYRITQQSGEFSHNPFTLRWNRRRVVVTFERTAKT